MIMRLLPLVIFSAGLSQGADKLKPLLDVANVVRTQMELRGINSLLTTDVITGTTIVDPESFQEYLKRNLRTPEGQDGRDTSLDPWGKPYRLRKEQTRVVVLSSGPDQAPGTPDDLQTSVRLD